MAACYLLRFDDICPTMNWAVWREIEIILAEYQVRPILAVIPDNRDPFLVQGQAAPDFWDRARAWQAQGWTIGMHGYQHRYTRRECGLVGLNHYSEFAGHDFNEQYTRLAAGRSILEAEGIHPEVFIAPAHSFDWMTVDALRQLGFRSLSDGFSLFPFTDRFGITWVPQQLWSFRRRPFGTWTVCMHMNSWQQSDLKGFRAGLQQYHAGVVDLETVLKTSGSRLPDSLNRLSAKLYGAAIHLKARVNRISHPCEKQTGLDISIGTAS